MTSEPFQLSSDYVDELAALRPGFGSMLGRGEHDHRWADYGPDGWAASQDLHLRYRQAFAAHRDHPEPHQRTAAQVMHRVMADRLDEYDHDDHLVAVRHMASPFQMIGRVFDMMSRDDADAWDAVVARLRTMPVALASYRRGLEEARLQGAVSARRQVESVMHQAKRKASEDSAFNRLRSGVPATHAEAIEEGIAVARSTTAEFAAWLEHDYLPHARERDAAGEERYRRWLRRLVGADIDPREAYAWGWDELHRILGELRRVGDQILPGATLSEIVYHLRRDAGHTANSVEEFITFIDGRERKALRELSGSHFDVAEKISTLTVNMAPKGSPLGAYYLAPSEDFTRPGSVWYSMGNATRFPLFHAVSTAYHEGFPGHHLQRGTAMVNRDRVSRGQRTAVWYPGYGEGWALYAERLMGELGYLEDPVYSFGMLTKHSYRATRVVVDIGLHLELDIPADAPHAPGQRWSYDVAVEYMERFGVRTKAQARNETLRYLGWPGQAPAYKLGEREMLAIRTEAQRRLGGDFDLKAFHDRLIGDGPMPFDLLGDHVLGTPQHH